MANRTQRLLSGVVAKLFAAVAVALATGIAWVLYELLVYGDVDNLADAWVRSVGRTLGDIFAMEAETAAFVLPLAAFVALALVVLYMVRKRT